MGRDLRIEEVDNGFVLRAWKPVTEGNIYADEDTAIASKDEVLGFVSKWIEKQAPPFKKGE